MALRGRKRSRSSSPTAVAQNEPKRTKIEIPPPTAKDFEETRNTTLISRKIDIAKSDGGKKKIDLVALANWSNKTSLAGEPAWFQVTETSQGHLKLTPWHEDPQGGTWSMVVKKRLCADLAEENIPGDSAWFRYADPIYSRSVLDRDNKRNSRNLATVARNLLDDPHFDVAKYLHSSLVKQYPTGLTYKDQKHPIPDLPHTKRKKAEGLKRMLDDKETKGSPLRKRQKQTPKKESNAALAELEELVRGFRDDTNGRDIGEIFPEDQQTRLASAIGIPRTHMLEIVKEALRDPEKSGGVYTKLYAKTLKLTWPFVWPPLPRRKKPSSKPEEESEEIKPVKEERGDARKWEAAKNRLYPALRLAQIYAEI